MSTDVRSSESYAENAPFETTSLSMVLDALPPQYVAHGSVFAAFM